MTGQRINWYKYAAPANFYPLAGKMIPWFAVTAALLFLIGLYMSFFVAPTDYQQHDAYRIIFIHVPPPWMGIFFFLLLALSPGVPRAFNPPPASIIATPTV